jgi:hypothetical protein
MIRCKGGYEKGSKKVSSTDPAGEETFPVVMVQRYITLVTNHID